MLNLNRENQLDHWAKWLWENSFLKCILGLHRVTAGEIIYNNVPLSSMEEEENLYCGKTWGWYFKEARLHDGRRKRDVPMQMFTQAPEDEIRERANIAIDR